MYYSKSDFIALFPWTAKEDICKINLTWISVNKTVDMMDLKEPTPFVKPVVYS